MRPLVFTWPYALVFWAVDLWAFAPEMALVRRARGVRTSEDAGSLQVILHGTWMAMVAAFALAFVPSLSFPKAALVPAFFAGTAMLFAGTLLRRHCWKMLGEYFTGDVRVQAGQPVITRGAYRWIRHPSYSAAILMFAGIGVALGNWGSAAFLVVVPILVYTYRVRAEERALVQKLGEPYVAYMKTTKRFVPFIV